MKSWKLIGMAGLMLTSLYIWSGPVQAQYYGQNIEQREAAEQQRIQNGIRSGALTPQEARRLEAEQRRIEATKDRMRADGRLDPREQARLNQMLNKANRDISREKHDNQVAYPGYGNYHDPRSRLWQDNQRRYRQPRNESRGLPPRLAPCAERGQHCVPGAWQHPKEQGNSWQKPHRERRAAWNY